MSRPIKFRVWDGATMDGPTENVWGFDQNGRLWSWERAHYEDATALQFTGLHDADGKEIYEGDVVEFEYGPVRSRGVVAWLENGFWIRGVDGRPHMPNVRRVIGNIYENPELIAASCASA